MAQIAGHPVRIPAVTVRELFFGQSRYLRVMNDRVSRFAMCSGFYGRIITAGDVAADADIARVVVTYTPATSSLAGQVEELGGPCAAALCAGSVIHDEGPILIVVRVGLRLAGRSRPVLNYSTSSISQYQ